MSFRKLKTEKLDEEDFDSMGRKERKAKNPIKRWRRLDVALTIMFALFFVLLGLNTYTSSPSFCASCHELQPEYITFHSSDHNQISCIQCHSKPGFKNLVQYKVNLLKEVYSHYKGAPKQLVLNAPVTSENCMQCHSKNRLVTATGDLKVNHKGHIEKGIPCTTCHRGVAHAKIVERGINDSSTYGAWTVDNTEKLIDEKYVRPNMGTCIDCHEQVNQGKQPWKDTAYSLPKSNIEKDKKETSISTTPVETPEIKAGILERDVPENQQKVILEAMGKQQTNVKIPMECFTCHREIKLPKNHNIQNWSKNHGDVAVKDLGKCVNCHKDSLWIKELDKQDIKTLLTNNKKVTYKQDLITARNVSRNNLFCRTCHEYSPESHNQDRYTWLTNTHRQYSGTPEERKICFVCHDNDKPTGNNQNAPSDVYCDFCHNGEFKGEPR